MNTATSPLETNTPKTDAGYVVGQSATADKIGFYGATPIVQPTSAAQAAVVTTAATSTTPFGFSEAQANAIVTLVNRLRTDLISLGLIKGS
jgi:hypothetical protein